MTKVSYFGRDGRQCQKVEWDRLRADSDYRNVRQYDNDEVLVLLEWTGDVLDAHNLFPDCYKLFRLHVYNYNDRGSTTPDPVGHGRTFPTEDAAIRAYEDFLERWTKSHRSEDGKFEEVDNALAPPPPPDPDAPSSDVSTIKLGAQDDGMVW